MLQLDYYNGRGKYRNEDATERVINCVMPSSGQDCIAVASADLILDQNSITQQMKAVQDTFRNEENIGKRIVHGVIEFDSEAQLQIKEHPEKAEEFCSLVSHYYHSQGHQSVCSMHKMNGALVADIAVNSVNFITGSKLVCTNSLESDHQAEFQLRFDSCFNQ